MATTTAKERIVKSPSDLEIRAALNRVVTSVCLRRSPRLVSFLCFVVEATLAGQANRIKGYCIAVGALGRSDDFDPKTNPIVRVEPHHEFRDVDPMFDEPPARVALLVGFVQQPPAHVVAVLAQEPGTGPGETENRHTRQLTLD